MKKTNNKGFSLVELIVVIAIMAVLMVVVAPQFLKYVEKSRLQRDNSAIAEIANAAKIAMADETINKSIENGANEKITFATGATDDAQKVYTFGSSALGAELTTVFGSTVTLESSTYTAVPEITVAKETNGVVSVKATIKTSATTPKDMVY